MFKFNCFNNISQFYIYTNTCLYVLKGYDSFFQDISMVFDSIQNLIFEHYQITVFLLSKVSI